MNLKKVFMSFALCLAILSGFSISASARTIDNNTVKPSSKAYSGASALVCTHNGNRLNVRRGPGTNYSIIGSLGNDEPVAILGSNSSVDWQYVEYKIDGTNDVKVGWVYGKYIFTIE